MRTGSLQSSIPALCRPVPLQPMRAPLSHDRYIRPACGENAHNAALLGIPRCKLSNSFSISSRPSSRCQTRIAASAGTQRGARRETLPIFPLGIVAFPASPCPLHIFEARYRVLFNTLLKGADDLEEGLIQEEKSFAGTRRFGMCWGTGRGEIASVGTTLQIQRHHRMDDGRMAIENIGVERFKILNVIEDRPVLVCEVEILDEEDEDSPEVHRVADELRETFRTLIRLHAKHGTIKLSEDEDFEPEELWKLGPRDLSFWIASNFRENPQHQQVLLQENSTLQRLKDEKAVLEGSVNYLRARMAVESVLRQTSTASEPDSSSSSGGSSSEAKPAPPSPGSGSESEPPPPTQQGPD